MKLNNLKYIFVIIIMFLMTGSALAQNVSKTGYKVRAKGRQLVITYQGKAHLLNTAKEVDAEKVTGTNILFAARKNNFTYLVIDVIGQSRAKQNDRQCGAGEENDFLWIKLDANWKVTAIKSIRYESCWASTSSENFKITGNLMSVEIANFRENTDSKVSYNAAEPEKGFKIETKAMDKN